MLTVNHQCDAAWWTLTLRHAFAIRNADAPWWSGGRRTLFRTGVRRCCDRLRKARLPQIAYRMARPFPHVVIDDAFDQATLTAAVAEWPDATQPCWRQFQNGKHCARDITQIPPKLAAVLRYGLSSEFVGWLEWLTGIDGLIADQTFGGGGLHEVERGGALAQHVDFARAGALYRRVNCLLYVNPGWQPDWGGNLEFRGDPHSPEGQVPIAPEWNRLAVFESSNRSWHGHEKVTCPPSRSRRAIALYFYTATPGPLYTVDHSTLYFNRKSTKKILSKLK